MKAILNRLDHLLPDILQHKKGCTSVYCADYKARTVRTLQHATEESDYSGGQANPTMILTRHIKKKKLKYDN